jgi:hypothetical protein
MKISNVDKFEEKLRKIESDLHIDPTNRILISYTRNRFENIDYETRLNVFILTVNGLPSFFFYQLFYLYLLFLNLVLK